MKQVYALLLTQILAVTVFSQSSITGTIKDSAQQVVVPFVSVSLYKASDTKTPVKTLVSDKEGHFDLTADTGNYTLVLTHTAFARKAIAIQISQAAMSIYQSFT